MMKKNIKKIVAVILVCLTVFAVMQLTASATDVQFASQPDSVGLEIGHILGAIVFSPFYLVGGLLWLVTYPFRMIF